MLDKKQFECGKCRAYVPELVHELTQTAPEENFKEMFAQAVVGFMSSVPRDRYEKVFRIHRRRLVLDFLRGYVTRQADLQNWRIGLLQNATREYSSDEDEDEDEDKKTKVGLLEQSLDDVCNSRDDDVGDSEEEETKELRPEEVLDQMKLVKVVRKEKMELKVLRSSSVNDVYFSLEELAQRSELQHVAMYTEIVKSWPCSFIKHLLGFVDCPVASDGIRQCTLNGTFRKYRFELFWARNQDHLSLRFAFPSELQPRVICEALLKFVQKIGYLIETQRSLM